MKLATSVRRSQRWGARQTFHFGHFKIVSAKNQGTEFQLNTVERRHVLPKDTTPHSGESVNVKARRGDPKSPPPVPEDQIRRTVERRQSRAASAWGGREMPEANALEVCARNSPP